MGDAWRISIFPTLLNLLSLLSLRFLSNIPTNSNEQIEGQREKQKERNR